jgi:hypothetical protein
MAQSVCFLKSFIGQCCRVLEEAAMVLSGKFGHIAKLYRYMAALCSAGCSRRKYGYCGLSYFHDILSTAGILRAFVPCRR